MEGSAAPEPSDHRADAGIPASLLQGHDAGRSGVETEEQAEHPQAQPSTQETVVPSPPRAAPVPETAAPVRPTPVTPAQATPAAPTPTPVPVPSALASKLQQSSPARITAPAQGAPSTQQSPAVAQAQKRPAASSPPQQQPKRSRTDAAAAGTGTSTSMVVHAAQAAINAAGAYRLGTVRARTSGGENLASMEADWIAPWNDADVDMDVACASQLGGVHLGQKTTRTQNALNELFNSWNEQMKTTKVFLLPT